MPQLQTGKLNEKDWYHLICCVASKRNISYCEHTLFIFTRCMDKEAQWIKIINSVLYGVLTLYIIIPSLEFVCAQAPYNVRGLLNWYIQLNSWIAFIAGNMIAYKFLQYCQGSSYSLFDASVGAGLGIPAFIVYIPDNCLLVKEESERWHWPSSQVGGGCVCSIFVSC